MTASPIDELARLCGIETRFKDARGGRHDAPRETVQAILGAMGIDSGTDRAVRAAIRAIEAEDRSRLAPEVIVANPGHLRIDLAAAAEWRLDLADGGVLEGRTKQSIAASPLPVGVHRLTVTAGSRSSVAMVLVRPATAPGVRALTGRDKLWGVAAPLYGLRSENNLGLGTYGDLAELAEVFGRMGADYLAINPVHALFPTEPSFFSPYSCSHRRFLNTAHIDVRAVPEFAATERIQQLLSENAAALERLRAAELIDYPAVAAVLRPLLGALFESFEASCSQGSPRAHAFDAWCASRGDELVRFATHQALAERHGAFWPGWPAELRDPGSPVVRRFAAANPRLIRHHCYLQWIAETQLDAAQTRARAAGMGLGLVSDLAVGVHPDGAEVWGERQDFATGISLGAPPDAFNPAGQNWHLAPLRPGFLRRDGFRAFAETLACSMRWAGGIRIDHIIGFARSYWIPDGCTIGAYVRYPLAEMLAVAAIIGHRHGCLVIGEDLGNVPEGLREGMGETGVHGCRLVCFERDRDGGFKAQKEYPALTVASFGSHDVPNFRWWWHGRDIAIRLSLGLIDAAEANRERAAREKARVALRAALSDAAVLSGNQETDGPTDEVLDLALHRFLAGTSSALVTVQAENLFPGVGQLNVPGTVYEHPNWRCRLPGISEWQSDTKVRSIARMMSEWRPRRPTEAVITEERKG
jgi:4-alpha-glucanotransferase